MRDNILWIDSIIDDAMANENFLNTMIHNLYLRFALDGMRHKEIKEELVFGLTEYGADKKFVKKVIRECKREYA